MADLIEVSDIEAHLGRALTSPEVARVAALMADASGSIRSYTKQTITEETTTDVLRIRNGRVRLPQRPVTAVTVVVNSNGDPVIYQWDGADSLVTGSNVPDAWAWVPFASSIVALTVTYTHGYNPIPDDIIGVGCSMVMRALGREPVDAGMTSESIQGYSYTIGAIGAAGALGLLDSERMILDPYCRVGGQISTAPSWITG